MTFNEHILKNSSEKISLVWLHPRQRKISDWDGTNAPTYSLATEHFVDRVFVDGAGLDSGTIPLSAGEYYFDSDAKTLYVRLADDSDPAQSFTVIQWTLFYSDSPVILPYDLASGRDVYYSPHVDSIGTFKADIDPDDLTGISLSGSGGLTFNNNDGEFFETYDKLFWDGSQVDVFLYGGGETKKIFKGFIESKSYEPEKIRFGVKDELQRLRNEVPLGFFSSTDGELPEELYGKPKRRIYGRVNYLEAIHTDMVKDGFLLTGTFSGVRTEQRVSITGGDVYNELSKDDEIYFLNGDDEVSIKIESYDGTYLYTESEIDQSFSTTEMYCRPAIPYRFKNREYFIAGHELKEPSTTITTYIELNKFEVADASDFDPQDIIFVNTEKRKIRRISFNEIILETNLNSAKPIGTTVRKSPIQSCYLRKKKLLETDHFTITNNAGECKITLTATAERDKQNPVSITGTSIQFNNGSRTVDGVGTNFPRDIKPRDWIGIEGTSDLFEVFSVESEASLTIREIYTSITTVGAGIMKRPEYASDDAVLVVNALGKTKDNTKAGDWIKTAPEAIYDMLEEAEVTAEEASFLSAATEAPYLISIMLPLDKDSSRPTVRDTITKLNKSVFGSIYYDDDLQIKYSVLTPKKENLDQEITDIDVISFGSESSGTNITRTITGNYRPFDQDPFSESQGFLTESVENEDVKYLSSLAKEEVNDIYLYYQEDALTIIRRFSLLRESANTVLKVKSKLQFVTKNLNDVLLFKFDRLFSKFGTAQDKNRIGVITKIEKSSDGTTLEISDISGMMNKVAVIAEDTASDYSASTDSERASWGFITDNNGIITTDDNYKTNLIG